MKAIKQLNAVLGKVFAEADRHSKLEKAYKEAIEKLVLDGEIPMIVYDSGYKKTNFSWLPLYHRSVHFIKAHSFKDIYGQKYKRPSTISIYSRSYQEGKVKIVPKRVFNKIMEIDQEIVRLKKKRQRIFKKHWDKMKPLTTRKAKQVTEAKNKIRKEFGLRNY